MLYFLKQFPSARTVLHAKKGDIEKALICPNEKRKRVMVSVDDLIVAAKNSVASASAAKKLIISGGLSFL